MGVLFGTNGGDSLTGGSDGDTFIAQAGADTISGGDGNDTILVSPGNGSSTNAVDEINGGNGSDVVIVGGVAADYDVTFGAPGQVILTGKAGTDAEGYVEQLTSVETVVFDTGAMRIVDPAGGTGAFTTIQSAVDASAAGDVVVVTGGTYAESVSVENAITLIGDPAATIIDSPGTGYGISLGGDIDDAAGGAGSVVIDGFELTGNSSAIIATSDLVLDSLIVRNSNIHDNTNSGVRVSQDRVANVTVSGSTFTDNGPGQSTSGSIVLFEFTGNATIEDTTITSTLAAASSSGYAIQIAGFEQATYDVTSPMGNVTMSNVDITGEFKKPALMIQGFNDLSGFNATDVTIDAKTDYAGGDFSAVVFIDPVGSSGADAEGNNGYPGYLEQTGSASTLDLSGITVTNRNADAEKDVFVRGLDGNDFITGTNANDALNFPAENDTDYGGNDSMFGMDGEDTFFGGAGDDLALGGADTDTFVLSGSRDGYTIVETGHATYSVTDNDTLDGDEGTDTLVHVEKILFAGDGQTIELDANSPFYDGTLERFSESFEDGESEDSFNDEDNGWIGGQVAVVPSGTDGITAADGSEFAIFEQTDAGTLTGPFSKLGGYRAYWPGGYEVEGKFFLDTSWATGEGFDVSVASNDQSGVHLQDFIFHVTQDTSTGQLLVGAGNGSTFDPIENLEDGNHAVIDTTGWYTFNWEFYENSLGNLEVAMNVYDDAGNWLFTEVSGGGDDIATTVGGNRYMWFTNIDVTDGIAVDDFSLSTVDTNPIERGDSSGILQASYATIAEAIAEASPGDIITLVSGDYSAESPVSVTVDGLTFSGPADATGVELVADTGVTDISLGGDAPIDVTGNELDNAIVGNDAGNDIDAGVGDDTVTGGGGDDSIDGGAGDGDVAVYTNAVTDYEIAGSKDLNGRFTSFTGVTDDGTNDTDDGADTLTNIERLGFSDAKLDINDPIQLFNADGDLVGTFADLEAAVAAASSGDTLNLAAGEIPLEDADTADGQVLINKDLTIVGAGKDLTTLLAQADTGTSGAARGMIVVSEGVMLDISDLGIDGNGHLAWQGIRHRGSGTIENVAFEDIQYNPSNEYQGVAVAVFGEVSDVDITNSTFSNIGRVGAVYFGANTTGEFTGNTYTGKGAGDHLDYAVEVGAGAQVLVEGNTISDNIGVAASDGSTSAGILVTTYFGEGSNAVIRDNTLEDNTTGVSIGFDENDTSDVTFEGTNTISGTGTGIDATGNPTVTDANTITGAASKVVWNGGDGANAIEGASLGDELGGGAGNDTVTGNGGDDTIDGGTGNDTAVYSGEYAGYAIDAVNGTVTDTDSGDGDDGEDTFTGIETLEFSDKSVLIVGSDGFPTIQSAVDAASDGDTIIVLAGNYTETVTINKMLTIEGAQAGTGATGTRGAESSLTGAFHFQPGSAGSTIDGFTVNAGATILSSLTTAYVQDTDISILNTIFDRDAGGASFDVSRGVVTATSSGDGLTVSGSSFTGYHTGVFVNPGAENVAVSDNVFTANMVGMSNDGPDEGFSVVNNTFDGNLFEQIGVGVIDEAEDLSAQIGSGNVFTNTGSTPLVSIYPLRGDVQQIIGTEYADTFNGDQTSTSSPQLFQGLGGDDIINGGGGDDLIAGGTGADTMSGGTGDDSYEVDDAGDVVIENADEGTDTVYVVTDEYTLTDNVENGIVSGEGEYLIYGNSLKNELTGNDDGGKLVGGSGRDTLTGGEGEDTLVGGGGADSMDGGEGDDRYDVAGADSIIDTGTSTMDLVVASNFDLDLRSYTGVERAIASGSKDLALTGDDGENALRGNSGDNLITGNGGADQLTGGTGDDFFDFNLVSDSAAGDSDMIRDFQVATIDGPGDTIDLFDIDAKTTSPLNNAFSFIDTDAFTNRAGQLRYESSGPNTVIQGDVDGDGVADLEILLLGAHTLSDADFVL